VQEFRDVRRHLPGLGFRNCNIWRRKGIKRASESGDECLPGHWLPGEPFRDQASLLSAKHVILVHDADPVNGRGGRALYPKDARIATRAVASPYNRYKEGPPADLERALEGVCCSPVARAERAAMSPLGVSSLPEKNTAPCFWPPRLVSR
jgi:hypothetical protein